MAGPDQDPPVQVELLGRHRQPVPDQLEHRPLQVAHLLQRHAAHLGVVPVAAARVVEPLGREGQPRRQQAVAGQGGGAQIPAAVGDAVHVHEGQDEALRAAAVVVLQAVHVPGDATGGGRWAWNGVLPGRWAADLTNCSSEAARPTSIASTSSDVVAGNRSPQDDGEHSAEGAPHAVGGGCAHPSQLGGRRSSHVASRGRPSRAAASSSFRASAPARPASAH
eukprot:CAMPEP_0176225296 /NCGR_PEP_ID=MMETSP0121_2-20121125/21689_1 /TAXON_ID=160619 /ORGANISM="Kryptoperidinium foliaceum, Strain CCMP 1326" /LENGTH=221 /DNA_ID=CAMNT_0017564561 /DNA_START=78 /DNA_END=741 /DNA_ORIENTATION=-